MNIGKMLHDRRKELNLTLESVGKAVGVAKSTVRKWESGDIANMRRDKISALARVLNIDPTELMDWENKKSKDAIKQIPLLGTIAAGEPIYAEQNIETYLCTPDSWRVDFALRVKGESMIGAGIPDGSVVLCKAQQDVDDGQIAVCIVNGDEATLKRVRRFDDYLVLHPENPAMEDIRFKGKDRAIVAIMGRALKVLKDVQ